MVQEVLLEVGVACSLTVRPNGESRAEALQIASAANSSGGPLPGHPRGEALARGLGDIWRGQRAERGRHEEGIALGHPVAVEGALDGVAFVTIVDGEVFVIGAIGIVGARWVWQGIEEFVDMAEDVVEASTGTP